MEQLSLAADSLLEVVPGVEPPLGFEVRLMERLGTGGATRRLVRRHWRLRQSALVLACLLLLAAAGVGAGWLVRGAGFEPSGRADRCSGPSPAATSKLHPSSPQAAPSARSSCTRAKRAGSP